MKLCLLVSNALPKNVEKICSKYDLNCIILEQNEGFVARAYNIGITEALGDVVLFTDDDAIPPREWIKIT